MTPRTVPLSTIKGLGPARIKALGQAGITSVNDLLMMLPVRYKDTLNATPIEALNAGQNACVHGWIDNQPKVSRFQGRTLVTARLKDETGTIRVQYFNQPWMAEHLKQGQEVLLYGPVAEYRGSLQLNAPSLERERGLLPVYKALPGLKSGMVAGLMQQALERLDECVSESLPESTRTRHQLCEINYAIRETHRPQSYETLEIARRRLTFENLLMFVTAMRLNRDSAREGIPMDIPSGAEERYWARMPFPPTNAQRRTLSEIAADMRGPAAMSRLVQGDVGCGKTAVALGAILMCVQAGYQAVLMAPTEILARQHLESAQKTLGAYGVRVGLLVGSLKATERKQALAAIGQCELMFIYDKFFGEYNQTVAQVLLTADVTSRAERRRNVVNTFNELLDMNIIPIVNENDTVAVDELNFGDNDTLSAIVATLVNADALMILTDIDGVYDSNPKTNPDAKRIPVINEINDEIRAMAGGAGTSRGTGGMATKIRAAEIAAEKNISTYILAGDDPENLYRVFDGDDIGTVFKR